MMTAHLLPTVANRPRPAYSSPVATLLATGRRNLINQTAHKRPYPTAGAFFVPVASSYGGCVWARLGVAGFRLGRFLPRTQLPPYPVGRTVAVPKPNGAVPMNHLHTALKNRAAAHRAMAFAAMAADSSASVRLGRYRKHIARSRHLLALAGVVGGEA